MSLARKLAGFAPRNRPDPAARPKPRPRAELGRLKPLDRVLAQLDALELEHQRTYSGYAARCPSHLGDLGRLNFEVVELDRERQSRDGRIMPAGSVLLYCQAYGEIPGARGCSQPRVIKALGLLPCDLFPGDAGEERADLRAGSRYRLPAHGDFRPPLDDDAIERWEELAARFEAALKGRHAGRLGQLADQLRVPESALARFHVGWRRPDLRQVDGEVVEGQCWTIPERDGDGRITAINRRYEDGGKRIMRGGRRGLYVPAGWRDLPGPVHCPEGFSDAAALVAAGACAIGRPSASGGVAELAELLAGDPRPIVVVGENDAKPMRRDGGLVLEHGAPAVRRPGYDGAVSACRRLRALMGRDDVTVSMPPAGFKDVRELLIRKGAPS